MFSLLLGHRVSRRSAAFGIVAVVGVVVPLWQADHSTAKQFSRQIIHLRQGTPAYRLPTNKSPVVASIKGFTRAVGARTVLPVVKGPAGFKNRWLKVALPDRPNGSTGWIKRSSGWLSSTLWQITIDRSRRTATASWNGKQRARFLVVVGADRTPTPLGRFFITERVRQKADSPLWPWALATSAYSNVLQDYAGGPGQIALHGRRGLPEPLGSFASHGCVRFANGAIAWLAARVPAGTPVRIVA